MHAISATATSRSDTPANVAGSVGVTPHKLRRDEPRQQQRAGQADDETGADEHQRLSEPMSPITSRRPAPSARRMPISRVRRLTEYAMTP